LDESAVNQRLIKEYGYAERGQKFYGKVLGKRGEKINVVSVLCNNKMIAPCSYKENMNTALFNRYIKDRLLPSLETGSTIIMDNARFHKLYDDTKAAIKQKECEVLYLPPYSPELNKIENYWAVMKKHIRKCQNTYLSIEDKLKFVFSEVFKINITNL